MVLNIQSYYIDVLSELELFDNCQIAKLRTEAYNKYNKVVYFFMQHFDSLEMMNWVRLNNSNFDIEIVKEGKSLIDDYFQFLNSNKVTNINVEPNGNFCDVTVHWIKHLLGIPDCINQKNIFNVLVSPQINWYSIIHNTTLWNKDLLFAKVELTRILNDYNNNQTLFVIRNANKEELFETPEQVVTFLSDKIDECGCNDSNHRPFLLEGNGLQFHTVKSIEPNPNAYISIAYNY